MLTRGEAARRKSRVKIIPSRIVQESLESLKKFLPFRSVPSPTTVARRTMFAVSKAAKAQA